MCAFYCRMMSSSRRSSSNVNFLWEKIWKDFLEFYFLGIIIWRIASSNEAIKWRWKKHLAHKYLQAITIRDMLTFQIDALQILKSHTRTRFVSFEQWKISIVAKLQMIGIFSFVFGLCACLVLMRRGKGPNPNGPRMCVCMPDKSIDFVECHLISIDKLISFQFIHRLDYKDTFHSLRANVRL